MKRIVTIQDISCVGKCSLTVALPILSAMGIETAVVPTAVLSNHTAFDGFTFHDLTEEIPAICAEWEHQKFDFSAVYSGYLGSNRQIEQVREIQQKFARKGEDGSRDCIRFVDPAMADGGSLYKGFTQEFAQSMARLCAEADVIVPNLTEACVMTGTPYREDMTEEELKDLVKRLASQGAKNVVLTGYMDNTGAIGALIYNSEKDQFDVRVNEKLPVLFHGTGDIFASVVLGGLMNEQSLAGAVGLAVDYTLECIRKTSEDEDRRWYGVNFEAAIPYLVDELRNRK